MRKVVLDRAICLKAGQCFYLQPSVFKADADGWPEIIVGDLDDETFEAAAVSYTHLTLPTIYSV